MRYIFQQVGKGGQDYHRVQLSTLDVPQQLRNTYDHITQQLETIFQHLKHACNRGEFEVFSPSLLISKKNCSRQELHSDFDRDNPNSKFCFAVIAGLESSTLDLLYTIGDKDAPDQINFTAGDLVFLRGDLIHAGSSYEKPNVRIHYFVELEKSNCRVDGNIYLYRSDQQQITIGQYISIKRGKTNLMSYHNIKRQLRLNAGKAREAKRLKQATVVTAAAAEEQKKPLKNMKTRNRSKLTKKKETML